MKAHIRNLLSSNLIKANLEGMKKMSKEFIEHIRTNGIFKLSVQFSANLKTVTFSPTEADLNKVLESSIQGQGQMALQVRRVVIKAKSPRIFNVFNNQLSNMRYE